MDLPTRVYQRRRLVVACTAVAALITAAMWLLAPAEDQATADRGSRAGAADQPPELPGGGRTIFPDRRVVAFYGHPADAQLGILGIGTPRQAGRRLLRQASAYERKTREVLPAMELLASVATFDAGPDGLYRRRTTDTVIRRYLRAARQVGALLVLDIQPGRAPFMPEVRALRRWLREPDVGLALDPEWHVAAGEVPGQVIGSVDAEDVNAVTAWLDGLVRRENLPQKLLIVHQFTEDMVKRKELLRPRRGLAVVLNADGFGSREVKTAKYHAFSSDAPYFFDGFKLFYEEDGAALMRPRQVLRLKPPPDVVVYE